MRNMRSVLVVGGLLICATLPVFGQTQAGYSAPPGVRSLVGRDRDNYGLGAQLSYMGIYVPQMGFVSGVKGGLLVADRLFVGYYGGRLIGESFRYHTPAEGSQITQSFDVKARSLVLGYTIMHRQVVNLELSTLIGGGFASQNTSLAEVVPTSFPANRVTSHIQTLEGTYFLVAPMASVGLRFTQAISMQVGVGYPVVAGLQGIPGLSEQNYGREPLFQLSINLHSYASTTTRKATPTYNTSIEDKSRPKQRPTPPKATSIHPPIHPSAHPAETQKRRHTLETTTKVFDKTAEAFNKKE